MGRLDDSMKNILLIYSCKHQFKLHIIIAKLRLNQLEVHSDSTVLEMKERVVLKYDERKKLLRHIKWIDVILDDVPWTPDLDYLEKYQIDLLAGDETISESLPDFFRYLCSVNRFLHLNRSPSISSTTIITRVVSNYDRYINKPQEYGQSLQKSGLSTSKVMEASLKQKISSLISSKWLQSRGLNIRIHSFVQAFDEKALHNWNILSAVKEALINTKTTDYYPERNATKELDHVDNFEDLLPLMHEMCCKYVDGWQNLMPQDLEISVVNGGLTNKLYKISISPELAAKINEDYFKEKGALETSNVTFPPQVLVRIYGEGTETFFNRENEHKIFSQFSELGIGPKLYGIFGIGRIEEFLSLHSLQQRDLPKLAPMIAQKIGEIHSSEIKGLSKSPALFDSLWTWLKAAQDLSFTDDPEKKAIYDELHVNDVLPQELETLWHELSKLNSPVVFCHNDLLGGNIMYDEETQKLCFIDYEYGAYNFRGFDIGNHFCERTIKYNTPDFPFFELDSRKYPTKEEQISFLKTYLETVNSGKTASEDELESLKKEVNAFALAAHFLWGLWGLIQSSCSNIEFGYMDFAKARFKVYYERKNEFLYGIESQVSYPDSSIISNGKNNTDFNEKTDESWFTQKTTHEFRETHFNTPTWCGHCKGFVFQPFGRQGYLCTNCDMKIHRDCLLNVTNHCISSKLQTTWAGL